MQQQQQHRPSIAMPALSSLAIRYSVPVLRPFRAFSITSSIVRYTSLTFLLFYIPFRLSLHSVFMFVSQSTVHNPHICSELNVDFRFFRVLSIFKVNWSIFRNLINSETAQNIWTYPNPSSNCIKLFKSTECLISMTSNVWRSLYFVYQVEDIKTE